MGILIKSSLFSLLIRLWHHMSRRRKKQFALLMVLLLVSAFTEVVSLGAVLPFIGILTQPEIVFTYPIVADVAQFLGILSAEDLVFPLTVAFALAALVAGGLRLLLLWVSLWLGKAVGIDLSQDVYRRTLYQPYSVHVARSSSEIISGITQKVEITTGMIISVVMVATSAVLFSAIVVTLFIINPMVAFIAVVGFGSCYGMIAYKTHNRLHGNSQCIAREQTQVVKALQEGLGAIRDILLEGAQEIYCVVYRNAVQKLQRAYAENAYIKQAPRYAIEALGLVLIAALTYILNYQPGGIAAALPVLGALALGAQRLLPLLQQLFSNWSNVIGGQAALIDVLELLDQPISYDAQQPASAPLAFIREINISNVYFRYGNEGSWVLNGINLTIPKGARIGIVGSTGSGKSTTLDLLMSLIDPVKGSILVDGQSVGSKHRRSWQRNIAHVPQSIFLSDATLAENIAFTIPLNDIDMDRVQKVARQAQIADFIESMPDGYQSLVGERGVRLSGGQRQRIGIARALYKQASVLVFDEATSALDNITERVVMDAIEKFDRDLTILLIAHRITTVKRCDTIFELENGRVVAQGTYGQLLEKSESFRNMANEVA